VGLAIPVNRATRAADELIETGRVDTPFLGVLGQTVNEDLAKEEGLPVTEGAFIVEVTPETEAEKAGVQPGDVITAVDEDTVDSMDDLIVLVRRRAVGDQVTLTLWRDGEEMTLEMTVGVKPR
jgi:S1-C subfamily serine protease